MIRNKKRPLKMGHNCTGGAAIPGRCYADIVISKISEGKRGLSAVTLSMA